MKLWVCLTVFALFATCKFDLPTWDVSHGSFKIGSIPSGTLFCRGEDNVFMGFGSRQLHDKRNQDNIHNSNEEAISSTDTEIDDALREVPSLPLPKSHDPADHVHQLEVNGEGIAMTELGPIIVNADGTLRRIENWSTLTKQEQANTIRVVTRRNKKRLEALKELQKEEEKDLNRGYEQAEVPIADKEL